MKAPTTSSRIVRPVRALREGSLSNRRNGRTRRAAPATALAFACTFLATSAVASAPATAAPRYSDFQPAYQNLGTWLPLEVSGNAQGNTPAVFETSGGNAYDLWLDKRHGLYTYEVAELGPDGGVLAPAQSIFGPDYWGGLSSQTTILANGPYPLVVFDGARGTSGNSPYNRSCVVGALGPKVPWTLESWSLSNDCYNPTPEATETATGELSAAWGGSVDTKQALIYHLGAGPTIPAKAPDSYTLTPGGGIAYAVNEAADTAGNDDVYVSWAESFAKDNALNGYYAKDVTTNGPSMRRHARALIRLGRCRPTGPRSRWRVRTRMAGSSCFTAAMRQGAPTSCCGGWARARPRSCPERPTRSTTPCRLGPMAACGWPGTATRPTTCRRYAPIWPTRPLGPSTPLRPPVSRMGCWG